MLFTMVYYVRALNIKSAAIGKAKKAWYQAIFFLRNTFFIIFIVASSLSLAFSWVFYFFIYFLRFRPYRMR